MRNGPAEASVKFVVLRRRRSYAYDGDDAFYDDNDGDDEYGHILIVRFDGLSIYVVCFTPRLINQVGII